MSGPPEDPALTLTNAEQAWEALADQLEEFIQAWENETDAPRLEPFLPKGPQALRQMALVEFIKVDLEYRWKASLPRQLEDYLAEHPELEPPLPCDLIYEEFHIRKTAGDDICPEEYLQRFPDQAEELKHLLNVESTGRSTCLYTPEQDDDIDVGRTIDDFDLLTRLGKGAFANVFLARQNSMERLVALKVSKDKSAEPQTLARLDHDNIVRVYDQRLLPERNLRLLYMQYVPGGALHDVIAAARRTPVEERSGKLLLDVVDKALVARGVPPPTDSSLRQRLARYTWPETVCWLGSRLADALHYAHQQGVLHRDVKPANVLITAEGAPKLVDFNVSFSSHREGATPAAYFGGSLAYMSPEQLEAANLKHERQPEDLDGRADLYSLAVMLWEMLTGERPFGIEQVGSAWTETLDQLAKRRRDGVQEAALKSLPADCPPGLDQALLECLDPDPDKRPQTGEEMARRLAVCLEPRAQRLLYPPAGSWELNVRSFPVIATVALTFIPNLLAAMFNLFYNYHEIVRPYLESTGIVGVVAAFDQMVLVVNAILFPLGIALGAIVSWPIATAFKELRQGRELGVQRIGWLRGHCLRLGHYAAAISIALWMAAGIIYPVAIHALTGNIPLSWYPHFLLSMTLCGLIGAAYPFFSVTVVSVRSFHPAFARIGKLDDRDLGRLERLEKWAWVYLVIALCVPLLALALMLMIGTQNRQAMFIVTLSGLAGFFLLAGLMRFIHNDLQALAFAVRPMEAPRMESGFRRF